MAAADGHHLGAALQLLALEHDVDDAAALGERRQQRAIEQQQPAEDHHTADRDQNDAAQPLRPDELQEQQVDHHAGGAGPEVDLAVKLYQQQRHAQAAHQHAQEQQPQPALDLEPGAQPLDHGPSLAVTGAL